MLKDPAFCTSTVSSVLSCTEYLCWQSTPVYHPAALPCIYKSVQTPHSHCGHRSPAPGELMNCDSDGNIKNEGQRKAGWRGVSAGSLKFFHRFVLKPTRSNTNKHLGQTLRFVGVLIVKRSFCTSETFTHVKCQNLKVHVGAK